MPENLKLSPRKGFAERINWQTFKHYTEECCVAVQRTETFSHTVLHDMVIFTALVRLPSIRGAYDSEYELLHIVRRRFERKARKTKDNQHVKEARLLQKQIKTHRQALPVSVEKVMCQSGPTEASFESIVDCFWSQIRSSTNTTFSRPLLHH